MLSSFIGLMVAFAACKDPEAANDEAMGKILNQYVENTIAPTYTNLAAKKEILSKLAAYNPDNLSDDDIQEIQKLVDEWNSIGFIPFKMKDKVAAQFKAAIEPFAGVVKTGRGRQNQRSAAQRDSGSPRDRLMRQYEMKKAEIQTYENNLGFMNASSKAGNGFVDAIKAKIETLKAEADELLNQIRSMDSAQE